MENLILMAAEHSFGQFIFGFITFWVPSLPKIFFKLPFTQLYFIIPID